MISTCLSLTQNIKRTTILNLNETKLWRLINTWSDKAPARVWRTLGLWTAKARVVLCSRCADCCWWISVQTDRLHVVLYKSARWWVTLEFHKTDLFVVFFQYIIHFMQVRKQVLSRQLTLLIIMHGVSLSIFNYFTVRDIRGLMCLSFSVYTLLTAIFILHKKSVGTV